MITMYLCLMSEMTFGLIYKRHSDLIMDEESYILKSGISFISYIHTNEGQSYNEFMW